MELFGVGAAEALLVLVITLIVVGPRRFPEIARQGGRWYRMARRFTADVVGDAKVALEELEQEVDDSGEGLRSIREIGKELSAGLEDTTRDLTALGRDVERAAGQAGQPADGQSQADEPEPLATPRLLPSVPRPGGDSDVEEPATEDAATAGEDDAAVVVEDAAVDAGEDAAAATVEDDAVDAGDDATEHAARDAVDSTGGADSERASS